MSLELKKEQLPRLIESTQRYFEEEMDMEISELKARLFVEFVFTEMAPIAYNQRVSDADQYLRRQLEDMPGSCFEHEMTYWKR